MSLWRYGFSEKDAMRAYLEDIAEVESLRAAVARVRGLCEHAISEGDYVDYDATELAKAILRALNGET